MHDLSFFLAKHFYTDLHEWRAATSAAAARNTLIDAQQGRIIKANEAISTATSPPFLSLPRSPSFHPLSRVCLVCPLDSPHELPYTYTRFVYGCANAKYVGRNFLFVQRFSNSLPASLRSAPRDNISVLERNGREFLPAESHEYKMQ